MTELWAALTGVDHVCPWITREDGSLLRCDCQPAATSAPIQDTAGRSGQIAALVQSQADRAHELRVEEALAYLRISAEARRRFRTEQDPNRRHPLDAGLLGDVLQRPADEDWRVEGLLPAGGRALLSAQRKTGKTTAAANLCRSLVTGERFLGRFPVKPISGSVVFLNYEVTARQCALWLAEVGVPQDRLLLVTLRGGRNPLADDEGHAELAALIRQYHGQALIVDPFGRAFGGQSQNDAGEVQAWLLRLDQLAEQAGCTEVVVTAHTGWDGERTRGSSALEDWPDAIITMTRDEAGARYLRAEGRDVDVDEDRLAFDPTTRRLTLTGAGDRTRAAASIIEARLVELLGAEPDLSGRRIEECLSKQGAGGRNQIREAIRRGIADGWITTAPGDRRATLHRLNPSAPVRGSAPEHWRPSSAPPPIGGAPVQHPPITEPLAGEPPVASSTTASQPTAAARVRSRGNMP